MKTLNHDELGDRRSTDNPVPTPSDIKRLTEIDRAYAERQAEDDARNAEAFDAAFALIARKRAA